MKTIPIKDLKLGTYYYGEGRNFSFGWWDGRGFVGVRYKFGDYFSDRELHYDADDKFGTFKPYKEIDVSKLMQKK